MRCPECEAAGLKSSVRLGEKRRIAATGDAQYWDEDDNFHHHTSQKLITPISCSNGHAWEHVGVTPCPTCGVPVAP